MALLFPLLLLVLFFLEHFDKSNARDWYLLSERFRGDGKGSSTLLPTAADDNDNVLFLRLTDEKGEEHFGFFSDSNIALHERLSGCSMFKRFISDVVCGEGEDDELLKAVDEERLRELMIALASDSLLSTSWRAATCVTFNVGGGVGEGLEDDKSLLLPSLTLLHRLLLLQMLDP